MLDKQALIERLRSDWEASRSHFVRSPRETSEDVLNARLAHERLERYFNWLPAVLAALEASSRQEERLSKELGRVCNKAEFPAFQRVMGTASAPKDLPQLIAYACELEDCVIGAKNKADGWRFIASEMGYEPGAHKHPPLGEWLTKRIAMFRARAALEPPHAKEQGS